MIVNNELKFKQFFKEDSNLTSMLSPNIEKSPDVTNGPDRFGVEKLRSLVLPIVVTTSKIRFIDESKSPILIQLDNGTKLYLSYDQFKKLNNPEVGKNITVEFIRNPENKNKNITSKINKITIH